MIKKYQHIVPQLTNELQMLILLSQDYLNNKEAKKIELLETAVDWNLFYDLTRKHRLTSHVLKNLYYLSNNVNKEIKQKLITAQKECSKKALLYSQFLIKIHMQLKKYQIPHLFFKGPLLSLQLYRDIGQRDYRDIDLLVPVQHIEVARELIQELGFFMLAPKKKLNRKQQKINYTISHHYHLTKPNSMLEIELHWNMTNPKTFFPIDTKKLIQNSININISNHKIPSVSTVENLAFLAAHGSIHQWYRLFWLKDFSEMIHQSHYEDIYQAWKLSQKLKLEIPFWQACILSHIIYNIDIPEFISNIKKNKQFIHSCIQSIANKDFKKQGLSGKIKFILYRLKLKPDFKYYFSIIYRLRTHFTDWEILPLHSKFFFIYYIIRPFLLLYKFLQTK